MLAERRRAVGWLPADRREVLEELGLDDDSVARLNGVVEPDLELFRFSLYVTHHAQAAGGGVGGEAAGGVDRLAHGRSRPIRDGAGGLHFAGDEDAGGLRHEHGV